MPRAFFALDVPQSAREIIASIQYEYQRKIRDAVLFWTPEESWHVTTHFLGSPDDASIDRLIDGMSLLPDASVRFSFWNVKYYPEGDRPRVLTLNLADPTGAAFSLREAQYPMILREGIDVDTRPWVPHITLGRVRSTMRGFDGTLPDVHIPAYIYGVPSLSLYESVLGAGPQYRPMATFDLLRT